MTRVKTISFHRLFVQLRSFPNQLLLLTALIVSPPQFQLANYYSLAAWGSPDSLLERSVGVRVEGQLEDNSRAGGTGLRGLEGGGSSRWGEWGKPKTEST